MTDELSSGPPPSGRSWVKAVGVCLAVLGVLALFAQLRGHAKSNHPAAAASVRAPSGLTVPTGSYEITLPPSPGASGSDGPRQSLPAPPSLGPPVVSATLDGIPAHGLHGVRLLLGGEHPTELGGNADLFDKVPLHANEAVSDILPLPSGDIVEVSSYDLSGPSASIAAYWVSRTGATNLIVNTDRVLPASSGDRIFAYSAEPLDESATSKQVGHLLEVSLAGKVLADHVLPAGLVPLTDTSQGLVFSDAKAGKVEVRDERSLVVRRTVAKSAAFQGADQGWLISESAALCRTGCTLLLRNIASGKSYVVAVPEDVRVGEIAVNPVQKTVALSCLSPDGPGYVVVADLATGAQEQIPGVVSELASPARLSWTSNGKILVLSVSSTTTNINRIALWPGDGGPLEVLPGSYPADNQPWSLTAL